MGEAKQIVKGSKIKNSKTVIDGTGMGVLQLYDKVIDGLENAAMVKLEDLEKEGDVERANNHRKLGLLYCAMSLTRRAREALKDYDGSLEDAAFDENF
jgi:hypothetical protein